MSILISEKPDRYTPVGTPAKYKLLLLGASDADTVLVTIKRQIHEINIIETIAELENNIIGGGTEIDITAFLDAEPPARPWDTTTSFFTSPANYRISFKAYKNGVPTNENTSHFFYLGYGTPLNVVGEFATINKNIEIKNWNTLFSFYLRLPLNGNSRLFCLYKKGKHILVNKQQNLSAQYKTYNLTQKYIISQKPPAADNLDVFFHYRNNQSEKINIRLAQKSLYPVKELYLKNKYGLWEYVAFKGKMDKQPNRTAKLFSNDANQLIVKEHKDTFKIKINSGYLTQEKYNTILDLLSSSPTCVLKEADGYNEYLIEKISYPKNIETENLYYVVLTLKN